MNVPALRPLQVNTVFNGGGTDNQTIELCLGLRQLGHEVTLAIRAGSNWEAFARSLGIQLVLLSDRGWRPFARIQQLAALIKRQNFNIVHSHQGRDYWPSVLAACLAGRGTRVVVTRHLMTRPGKLSCLLLLRFCDVVAVSRAVQSVLQRELRGSGNRRHLIYGGINTAAFAPERTAAGMNFRRQYGWADESVVFAIVGSYRLPRGKGHLEFLEAAARVKDVFPRARFALVGRGSMEPLLRERIRKLGLEDKAALVPFTTDVPVVMNAIDVLAHPATGSEALGLVVLEAMACCKPVIASRLDGIPEAFIENEHGLLVPPGEVLPLAEAMRVMLGDPLRRARMGRAGRDHVCRHFSRERQAQDYAVLYHRVCNSGRSV